jgi:hypothetical protein
VDEQDNVVSDPVKIANMLQDQFKSVFSSPLSESALSEYNFKELHPVNSIAPFKFSCQHVISAINEMKSSASCTRSNIPSKVFKECKHTICQPLMMFFQKSFDNGVIPLEYKTQVVIPLYKKGKKTEAKNHRPVSLTAHEIKIMERILKTNITEHLDEYNVICENQHGFRSNHSCATQLLSHLNYILSNLIQEDEVDSIYIDYSKAFDKVDHGLLLKKLNCYGINKEYLTWIENFLSDRFQTVSVDNCYSYTVRVQSGVPQGSVLGPLLFIIYINDLSSTLNNSACEVLTFADDTKLVSKISSTSDKDNLQKSLNSLQHWSALNNMELNNDKFEFISHRLVTRNVNNFFLSELPFHDSFDTYTTSNSSICQSSPVRDLGILVDNKLQWRDHYQQISKKAKQISAWIFNTFFTRDSQCLLVLFNTLVRPKLEYCCQVWCPHFTKDINCLEQVQRSFTHRIYGMKEINYWQRLKELNIRSLQRRRERAILIHVWKIKNYVYPNSIDLIFKKHERSNSIKAVLKPLPKIKGKLLTIYEESFIIRAAKLWNILPPSLTQIVTLNSFILQLDKFLDTVPDEPPLPGYPIKNHNSLLEQCC